MITWPFDPEARYLLSDMHRSRQMVLCQLSAWLDKATPIPNVLVDGQHESPSSARLLTTRVGRLRLAWALRKAISSSSGTRRPAICPTGKRSLSWMTNPNATNLVGPPQASQNVAGEQSSDGVSEPC